MDEKRFYDEKEETKQIPLNCPHCHQENTYPVRWMVRTKKSQAPGGANDEDRKQLLAIGKRVAGTLFQPITVLA